MSRPKVTIKPGDRFGSWTVIKEAGRVEQSSEVLYLCKCDCGREGKVRVQRLLTGRSKSCGKCNASAIRRTLYDNPPKTNQSGRKGVRWNAKDKRWEAYITIDGNLNYLGQYTEKADAIRARETAEAELEREFHESKKTD